GASQAHALYIMLATVFQRMCVREWVHQIPSIEHLPMSEHFSSTRFASGQSRSLQVSLNPILNVQVPAKKSACW
ncbi:MAG: hypothetical protein RLN86_03665, partial [Cyclobacteriaceae bacterium]